MRCCGAHLTLGHSPDALIATLAQALLRENAGFHAYQMLEAGMRPRGPYTTPVPDIELIMAAAIPFR